MIPAIGDALPRRGNGFSRGLGRLALRLAGWRIEGRVPNLPKMVWIGAPHTSNQDGVFSLATLMALGVDASTMIKASAFRGPLGALLRWFGAIPINRDAARDVVAQSIEQFACRARFVLLIAPEGTRRGAADWKRGFHRIASGAGVPILPFAIDYRRRRIVVGTPLTPGDADADLATLFAFYREHGVARHPERLSQPLR